jgi:hypothetical protein
MHRGSRTLTYGDWATFPLPSAIQEVFDLTRQIRGIQGINSGMIGG